jgi:signal peptide peptidase SppA
MMSKGRRNNSISMEALSRIDSRDMLILQDTSAKVMADLTRFYETDAAAEGATLEVASRESLEAAYGFAPDDDDDRKPFAYQDGVAVIPIHGTLLNRFNGAWGFVTGYQYIRRMLNLALDDEDVEVIVFDVDSPGGEAAGCFELAREIMASRRVKPSLAMVDALAASGGIALGVAPTAIYAIPSARVGSIGVYRMHVSYEGALKDAGIKVTFATAGDHKVEGNPYQDLPQKVLDEWRESAGKTWDDFIALVAEARDLSEDEVRATQARVYRADEALAKGLIDAVNTPTEAVAAFLAELADSDPSTDDEEETTMADPKAKEVTSSLTEADITRIATIAAEAGAKAAAAVASTIERKQAIRDHATAIGPQAAALAKSIIDNDTISAEDGIGMLDAAFGIAPKPKAKVAAPKGKQKAAASEDDDGPEDDEDEDGEDGGEADESGEDGEDGEDDGEEAARAARKGKDRVNHFERAMGKSKHPNAGGGKANGGGEDGGRAKVNPLLADHAKVTGADWSSKALAGKAN